MDSPGEKPVLSGAEASPAPRYNPDFRNRIRVFLCKNYFAFQFPSLAQIFIKK